MFPASSIPKILPIVKNSVIKKFTLTCLICDTKPTVDTRKIINNDVLMALLIGIFTARINAGTIKNPPPTP